MNRLEYMNQLEQLLAGLSDNEKSDALSYYNDYFNDAGVENEQEVIESLGDPKTLAGVIREGLSDGDGKEGEFSENGFTSYHTKKNDELTARGMTDEERGFSKQNKISGGMIILIVIICIFALPVLGPAAIAILSVLFGIICAVVAVLAAVLLAGVGITIAGIALVIAGIAGMFFSPLAGATLLGVGLLLLGIGILLVIAGGYILTKAVPPMIRGIVKLCRMPFERKGGVKA